MMDSTSEYHLHLTNDGPSSLRLVLEPWAEEWTIDPGHQVQLIGQGQVKEARFELRFKPAVIVVYAWTGSTVKIMHNGKLLPSASQSIPAM